MFRKNKSLVERAVSIGNTDIDPEDKCVFLKNT